MVVLGWLGSVAIALIVWFSNSVVSCAVTKPMKACRGLIKVFQSLPSSNWKWSEIWKKAGVSCFLFYVKQVSYCCKVSPGISRCNCVCTLFLCHTLHVAGFYLPHYLVLPSCIEIWHRIRCILIRSCVLLNIYNGGLSHLSSVCTQKLCTFSGLLDFCDCRKIIYK